MSITDPADENPSVQWLLWTPYERCTVFRFQIMGETLVIQDCPASPGTLEVASTKGFREFPHSDEIKPTASVVFNGGKVEWDQSQGHHLPLTNQLCRIFSKGFMDATLNYLNTYRLPPELQELMESHNDVG